MIPLENLINVKGRGIRKRNKCLVEIENWRGEKFYFWRTTSTYYSSLSRERLKEFGVIKILTDGFTIRVKDYGKNRSGF